MIDKAKHDKTMTTRRQILHYDGQQFRETEDVIATEYPLTIMINGEEFATLVCTPVRLEEMVIGFLASEGVIHFYHKEVKSIDIDEDDGLAYVELYHQPRMDLSQHSKRVIGSCCGKSRQSFYFQSDVRTAKTATTSLQITAETCIRLMTDMQKESLIFQGTGGVHNAAICDTEGLLVTEADIGRHNALDKLYGYCLKHQIPIRDKIITFSGRISSEIVAKTAKIGVGILLSKSAPTDLALEMAEELNMTTVGFIRNERFNVYTHPERLILA